MGGQWKEMKSERTQRILPKCVFQMCSEELCGLSSVTNMRLEL